MWTIVVAVCYAPMFMAVPPKCQAFQENEVTYHQTEGGCLATAPEHEARMAQELARQGMRMVQFGVRCDEVGDPA